MLDSKLNNNHLFEQPLYVKVSRDPLLLWVETDNRKIAASSFLPGTFQHNATVTNNRKKKKNLKLQCSFLWRHLSQFYGGFQISCWRQQFSKRLIWWRKKKQALRGTHTRPADGSSFSLDRGLCYLWIYSSLFIQQVVQTRQCNRSYSSQIILPWQYSMAPL